ncbi:YybS family protein [Bacillaceae bacterium]
MQTRMRAVLEGALLSGIYVVLLFLSVYTPVGVLTTMILPLPFVVYTMRHPVKMAVLSAGVSGFLSILVASLPAVMMAVFAGSVGIAMGTLYRKDKPALTVFAGGLLATLANFFLAMLLSVYLFDVNPIRSLQEMLQQSFAQSERLLSQFGLPPEQIAPMRQMVEMVGEMLPMLLFLASVHIALINHWVARKLLRKLGMEVKGFPAFKNWKWPRVLLIYYLVTIVLLFIPDLQNGFVHAILVNVFPVFYLMFIVQGLSFLFFLSDAKNWGRTVPIAAVVGLFLFPPLPFILSLLGIVDVGFDLRGKIVRH